MIHTSYYQKSGNNLDSISISNSTPPNFKGTKCKVLIPNWDIVSAYKKKLITKEQYTEIYLECLNLLDVHKLYNELDNKILLCWEKPTDFCHRHIVSKWFNDNGYQSQELK